MLRQLTMRQQTRRFLRFCVVKAPVIVLALFACGVPAHAQGGRYETIAISGTGRPLAGLPVAICQGLATTAASVANNVATLTMASNPQTAGFLAGMTLMVSGFTGADTYFNGAYTVASASATTISYALTHANASASSNGSAVQQGNTISPCAPLATIYTDVTLTTATANPFTADGLGNIAFWGAPGQYWRQLYGPSITTTLTAISVNCAPSATNCGAQVNAPNTWSAAQTFSGGIVVGTCASNVTLLNQQGPAAAITGTGADATVYTYTIPVGCIAAGKGFRVKVTFQHTTGSSSVSYKMKLGSTTLDTVGFADSAVPSQYTYEVFNNAGVQNAQNWTRFGFAGSTTGSGAAAGTSSENLANADTLTFTFSVASSDKVTPEMFLIQLIQ